jgi:hypothetical protein
MDVYFFHIQSATNSIGLYIYIVLYNVNYSIIWISFWTYKKVTFDTYKKVTFDMYKKDEEKVMMKDEYDSGHITVQTKNILYAKCTGCSSGQHVNFEKDSVKQSR